MRAAACSSSHLKMQMQDILLKRSQTERLRGATRLDRWGLIRIAPAVCTECRILNFARTVRKIVQSQKNIGVARISVRC